MISEIKQKNYSIEHFASSLKLTEHPMSSSGQKMKDHYYSVLEYLVKQFQGDSDCFIVRLASYHELLMSNSNRDKMLAESTDSVIHSFVRKAITPWKRKHLYCLFSDLALILLREKELNDVYTHLREYLRRKQKALLDEFCDVLWSNSGIPSKFLHVESQIGQFRMNHLFFNKPLMRVLVTATMSAGKSSLINALVGEDVVETRNEACTNHVHKVFNKPFDDGRVNRRDSETAAFIEDFADKRICFIDTPGVNSARYPNHREITRAEIKAGHYDMLVYVFNARYNGVDNDDAHLRYVLKNKPQNVRAIFVLNQLDAFNQDDSIEDSLNVLNNLLKEHGISEPEICPVSAKVGLLAQKAATGKDLNEVDCMFYDAYTSHFQSPLFDLSNFYSDHEQKKAPSLLSQCGIMGLKNVLFRQWEEYVDESISRQCIY